MMKRVIWTPPSTEALPQRRDFPESTSSQAQLRPPSSLATLVLSREALEVKEMR